MNGHFDKPVFHSFIRCYKFNFYTLYHFSFLLVLQIISDASYLMIDVADSTAASSASRVTSTSMASMGNFVGYYEHV